jgi:hypothetical protein
VGYPDEVTRHIRSEHWSAPPERGPGAERARVAYVVATVLVLAVVAATPALADLHHSHHSDPTDPVTRALYLDIGIAALCLLASLLWGFRLVIVKTRRIRDLFWAVPLVNLALFAVSIAGQPYPGGRAERFTGIGLAITVYEAFAILTASLLVASILAVVAWVSRNVRALHASPGDPPPGVDGTDPLPQDTPPPS